MQPKTIVNEIERIKDRIAYHKKFIKWLGLQKPNPVKEKTRRRNVIKSYERQLKALEKMLKKSGMRVVIL